MNDWFDKQDFNDAPLPSGHREQFMQRLDAQYGVAPVTSTPVKKLTNWKAWAIAASVAILLGIGAVGMHLNKPQSIATLSPQMAATQDSFNKTIDVELAKLNAAQSPETERIIADTKKNLKKLETDYVALQADFERNSNIAVMESMLINFKTRVAILEKALGYINGLKDQTTLNDEITL